MVFTAIEPAPGLSRADRRRAARGGPSALSVRTSYPSLLTSAGFDEIDAIDRTDAYLTIQRRWIDATGRRADEVRAVVGDEIFDQRLRDRRSGIEATERGLLRRTIYSARRPR